MQHAKQHGVTAGFPFQQYDGPSQFWNVFSKVLIFPSAVATTLMFLPGFLKNLGYLATGTMPLPDPDFVLVKQAAALKPHRACLLHGAKRCTRYALQECFLSVFAYTTLTSAFISTKEIETAILHTIGSIGATALMVQVGPLSSKPYTCTTLSAFQWPSQTQCRNSGMLSP